jgi:hypothetical protein
LLLAAGVFAESMDSLEISSSSISKSTTMAESLNPSWKSSIEVVRTLWLVVYLRGSVSVQIGARLLPS